MGKSPTGNRPVPKVAMGKGRATSNTSSAAYNGVRGSKSPTGNRPVPSIAKNTPNFNVKTNKVRPSPKFTPMPKTENEQAHHLKGRGAGGA